MDSRTGRLFLSDRPSGLSVLNPHGWRLAGTIPLPSALLLAAAACLRLIVSVGPNDVVGTAPMDRLQPISRSGTVHVELTRHRPSHAPDLLS